MIEQLILSKEHLAQIRAFLGEFTHKTVEPLFVFLRQLEAEQLQKIESERLAEAQKAELPKEES